MSDQLPEEKTSFAWTMRQCRSVYQALTEQILRLDDLQKNMRDDQIAEHVAIEVYATDLEAAREALYFETGMGEALDSQANDQSK